MAQSMSGAHWRETFSVYMTVRRSDLASLYFVCVSGDFVYRPPENERIRNVINVRTHPTILRMFKKYALFLCFTTPSVEWLRNICVFLRDSVPFWWASNTFLKLIQLRRSYGSENGESCNPVFPHIEFSFRGMCMAAFRKLLCAELRCSVKNWKKPRRF